MNGRRLSPRLAAVFFSLTVLSTSHVRSQEISIGSEAAGLDKISKLWAADLDDPFHLARFGIDLSGSSPRRFILSGADGNHDSATAPLTVNSSGNSDGFSSFVRDDGSGFDSRTAPVIAVPPLPPILQPPVKQPASTITWDGGTSGTGSALNSDANWTGDAVPTTTDEALLDNSIVAALPTQLTTTGASLTFGDLIWNSNDSSTITINTATSTSRSITLSGGGGSSAAIAAGGSAGDLLLLGTNATNSTLTFSGNANTGTGRLSLVLGASGNFDVVNSAATLNIDVAIDETGGMRSITKAGAGTAIFSGANSYSGGTMVNAGTLLINNSSGSGTGTGSVAVNNSGTVLGGTGTISGAVTINGGANVTAATNGTVGALTLSGGLTLTGASGNLASYLVDLTSGSGDALLITGDLDLSTTFDQIVFQGTTGAASYQLATYTGTLTGVFDTVTNLPSGYVLQYNTGEIDLVMTAVPEPSTWIGGLLAVLLLAWSGEAKETSQIRNADGELRNRSSLKVRNSQTLNG